MRAVLAASGVVVVMTACSLFSPTACPLGLLEGRLAPDGAGGAVVMTDAGPQPVRWPDGYRVIQTPDTVLVDPAGSVVAMEGETVYVGGGMDASNTVMVACGYVSRDPP